MASQDLLRPGRALGDPDRVLDSAAFLRESRKLLEYVLQTLVADSTGRKANPIDPPHERVRKYVRLLRGAVVALAHHKDFDAIDFLVSVYNSHSNRVMEVGCGLSFLEFNILRVSKPTEKELAEEIQAIWKAHWEVTTKVVPSPGGQIDKALSPTFAGHDSGKTSSAPPHFATQEGERVSGQDVRLDVAGQSHKHIEAALFQGLSGIEHFYQRRYWQSSR